MKHILLIFAVVMGQSALAVDKKPLTKEESAKVIEKTLRLRQASKYDKVVSRNSRGVLMTRARSSASWVES